MASLRAARANVQGWGWGGRVNEDLGVWERDSRKEQRGQALPQLDPAPQSPGVLSNVDSVGRGGARIVHFYEPPLRRCCWSDGKQSPRQSRRKSWTYPGPRARANNGRNLAFKP